MSLTKSTKKSVTHPIDTGDVLEQIENNPEAAAVMTAIKPFIPSLVRVPANVDQFIQLVSEKDWSGADALMWEHMNDDERDELSGQVLEQARGTVNMIHFGEGILIDIVKALVKYGINSYLGGLNA